MFRNVLLQIVAATAALWLAVRFVPGVELAGGNLTLLYAGVVLGLLNAFVKPVVNLLTLPLRILTLGLFSLVVNVLAVWAVDILFPELDIVGLAALLQTTLIVWLAGIVLTARQ